MYTAPGGHEEVDGGCEAGTGGPGEGATSCKLHACASEEIKLKKDTTTKLQKLKRTGIVSDGKTAGKAGII